MKHKTPQKAQEEDVTIRRSSKMKEDVTMYIRQENLREYEWRRFKMHKKRTLQKDPKRWWMKTLQKS